MENTRTVKLTLEQARELYKKDELYKSIALNSFSKKELEETSLPETYEEALEIYRKNNDEYYILYDTDCTLPKIEKLFIYKNSSASKNPNFIFKSEELAEAFIALQQLILIRDEYNGHKPIDYDAEYPYKPYSIVYDIADTSYKIVSANKYSQYKRLFVFHSEELAIEFLNNFKPLLNIFYKIMY